MNERWVNCRQDEESLPDLNPNATLCCTCVPKPLTTTPKPTTHISLPMEHIYNASTTPGPFGAYNAQYAPATPMRRNCRVESRRRRRCVLGLTRFVIAVVDARSENASLKVF